jgi:hypothetical protein
VIRTRSRGEGEGPRARRETEFSRAFGRDYIIQTGPACERKPASPHRHPPPPPAPAPAEAGYLSTTACLNMRSCLSRRAASMLRGAGSAPPPPRGANANAAACRRHPSSASAALTPSVPPTLAVAWHFSK